MTDTLGTTYTALLSGGYSGITSRGDHIEVFINRQQTPSTRYQIQSDDSGHEYFVEVGNEGEFERWLQTFEDNESYENYYEQGGHDYEESRIDGRFTFTDPKCGQ